MAGEHILIVDDEPSIQATLRAVLEDEGYRVSTAGSGEEAVRLAEELLKREMRPEDDLRLTTLNVEELGRTRH